jgi:hypothetical protein
MAEKIIKPGNGPRPDDQPFDFHAWPFMVPGPVNKLTNQQQMSLNPGMTFGDLCALAAMASIISADLENEEGDPLSLETIAQSAFDQAEAMLKERMRRGGGKPDPGGPGAEG